MPSKPFRLLLSVALLGALVSVAAPQSASAQNAGLPAGDRAWVYVGTYTRGESQGIYLCELDLQTGALGLLGLAGESKNPSFLAIHPNRRFLYAVSEVDEYVASKGGAVAALAINSHDGRLTLRNRQPSGGAGPCHVTLDRDAKTVLVANYGGGSVAVLPIREDGRLDPPSSTAQHEGSSINPQRQEGPHAHSINVDPANRFAVVADLGLDKILIYRFDPEAGSLTPNDPPSVATAAGAGPRHFAFHPSGKWAYAINELNNTVTAYKYDAQRGRLEEFQTLPTLPDGVEAPNTTAEVQVHPSGKFLYGSNRGHDSIAMFAIDAETGRLAPLGQQPSGGRTPRNFGIDPTGRFLLAAHQDSNTVVVHRIDAASGRLEKTEHQAEIPTPVCVKFLVQ